MEREREVREVKERLGKIRKGKRIGEVLRMNRKV